MQVAKDAIKLFNIQGAVDSIAPLGFGHINDSYAVRVDKKGYLLQRLNTNVFRTPEIVEGNLSRILSYAPDLFPPHILGSDGQYHQSDGNSLWRLQEFVHDSYSPTKLVPNELGEIARGYGKFTAAFRSEDLSFYGEAIPRFHDLHHRLNQFEVALDQNSVNRANSVKAEIETIQAYAWIATRFDELVAKGLPPRVCHNDAKAGNCLLSRQSGQFLKVVDLDTVGPGYALFDLGDMLRSMLFNIPENQAELDGLRFNKERLNIIVDTFLSECEDSLQEIEFRSLTFGGLYMTYMMATRFFTDYLNGDIYYKTSHKEENLVRTRNQLKILGLMSEAFA